MPRLPLYNLQWYMEEEGEDPQFLDVWVAYTLHKGLFLVIFKHVLQLRGEAGPKREQLHQKPGEGTKEKEKRASTTLSREAKDTHTMDANLQDELIQEEDTPTMNANLKNKLI